MVPLQQLFVLNSPFMAAGAKALAERCCAAASDDPARIRYAFNVALSRPATDEEIQQGLEFLPSIPQQNNNPGLTAWEQYAQILLSTNEFMFID
jgi:hypothetical protein